MKQKFLDIPDEFGKRLKDVRKFLGLTQHQLADTLGVNPPAIFNIESGKGSSSTTMYALLKFYAQFIYIDMLFDENFEIIKRTSTVKSSKNNIRTSIVVNKLKNVRTDLDTAIGYLE
ncbi:MAG: helix-turn-helix domain-containing protein [Tannerella sp.]|jgi:transcriptional regulator with XRE-family HTH domain|nr:helix-turn-helix domain-containing protein [Tannerella sp.]